MIFGQISVVPTYAEFQNHAGSFCRNVPLLNYSLRTRYQDGGK